MTKSFLIIIHFLINIVIQVGCALLLIFNDYTVLWVICWFSIATSLIIIDYLLSKHVLKRKGIVASWINHSADLMLLISNLALIGYLFYLDIIYRDIIDTFYSVYDVIRIIAVLFVDFCIVAERIKLIICAGEREIRHQRCRRDGDRSGYRL